MSMHWSTVVEAQALVDMLGMADLAVMDCRFSLASPDAGSQAYRQSHIPGARHVHLDHDLSDHRKQGAGRHPWPDAVDAVATLQDLGVTPGHQVVAYDDGDGAFASRLWFLLRALGHERVAVLDGGWTRWQALGLPVESDEGTAIATGDPSSKASFEGRQFDAARLLDAGQIESHLAAGGMLVDARAGERFRGEVEPLDRIAGHVPGAVNRPYAANLSEGRFKSSEALFAEFNALLGSTSPDDVAVMCGSGVTACHHLLAMEHAGVSGAKLFTGSWSGWISDPSRPVATGNA